MAYESLNELVALKTKLIARLSDALGDSPLPTYTIDGRKFEWNDYIKELRIMLNNINEQLQCYPVEEISVYLESSNRIIGSKYGY